MLSVSKLCSELLFLGLCCILRPLQLISQGLHLNSQLCASASRVLTQHSPGQETERVRMTEGGSRSGRVTKSKSVT